jgi:hypothetical protein
MMFNFSHIYGQRGRAPKPGISFASLGSDVNGFGYQKKNGQGTVLTIVDECPVARSLNGGHEGPAKECLL